MDLFDTVTLISNVLLFINIIYLIYLLKHLTKPMVLFMVLLVGIFCLEVTIAYLSSLQIPNLHLTHYYTIGQFFLLSAIYYQYLKRFKLVIPIGVALFSGILIYQLVTSKIVYSEMNLSGFLVSACILISYAFFYYVEYISEKKYWDTFNVGLFLYLGGSSIIFLTMNNWKDLEEYYIDLWTINGTLVILYQVFITLTIYRFHRDQKNKNGYRSL